MATSTSEPGSSRGSGVGRDSSRPPTLVVVSGPPGTGKTTLAHALADALGWPAVCRDEIKEAMAAAEPKPEPEPAGAAADRDPADDRRLNLKTLEAFFDSLGGLVASRTSLVAEAAFQDRLWRPGLEPLSHLAAIRVIRCVVDPSLARTRIARRAADDPSRAVHADAELLHRIAAGERPIESWVPITLDVPSLVVDTTQGWQPSLDRIVEFATLTP